MKVYRNELNINKKSKDIIWAILYIIQEIAIKIEMNTKFIRCI